MSERAAVSPSPALQHQAQRHQLILRKLRTEGQVRAVDLAQGLGVTHETIRKDLLILDGRGLLRKVHGGALPVEALADGAILLDAGSTTTALAENFPTRSNLTVITNTLPIALILLAHPNLTVHTVGGRVRPTTMAEVDHWALRALKEVRVDVAFLGTNAFSIEHGLSTPNDSEAAVKSAMVSAARRRILLADHSKLGRTAVFKYAELANIDVLVTDTGMTKKDAQTLERHGLEVIRA